MISKATILRRGGILHKMHELTNTNAETIKNRLSLEINVAITPKMAINQPMPTKISKKRSVNNSIVGMKNKITETEINKTEMTTSCLYPKNAEITPPEASNQ
jgi:hypothetical protein